MCLQCLNRILLALLWFFESKTLGNVYTKITQTTNEWSLSHWEKKIYQKWNSRWNRWISNKREMNQWCCECASFNHRTTSSLFVLFDVYCHFFFIDGVCSLLIHQWIFTFILLLLCCISLVIVFFRKRTNRLGKCKKLKWKWFVCKKI